MTDRKWARGVFCHAYLDGMTRLASIRVVKDYKGKKTYHWHLQNRPNVNGVCKTLKEAKIEVENWFPDPNEYREGCLENF